MNALETKIAKLLTENEAQQNLFKLAAIKGLEPSTVSPFNLYGSIGSLMFKHDKHDLEELLEKLPPVERFKFTNTSAYDIPLSYKDKLIKKKNLDMSKNRGFSFEYSGPKLSISNYNSLEWYSEINGVLISVKYCLLGSGDLTPKLRNNYKDVMGGRELVSSELVHSVYIVTKAHNYKTGGYGLEPTFYYCFNDLANFKEYAKKAKLI